MGEVQEERHMQSEALSANSQHAIAPQTTHEDGLPQTLVYRRSHGCSAPACLFVEKGSPHKPPKGKNESRQQEYLAQLSLQRQKEVSRSRANSEAAVDSTAVATPPKLRTTPVDGNRSSSTSRLPDSVPSSAGDSGHLPRYRKSTGATREAAQGDLDRRGTSTSPEKPRFSQSPASERPKGYQSHTERLQSFIREQQRKHPLEMISNGAVTKEDRRQRQEQWRTAFDRWKYLNGIPGEAKVFVVRGGYSFIRKALVARGWHENTDSESDFFDYKWTLKTKHLSRFRLHDCQYINHFHNSFACLTTKVGLLTSLADMHWHVSEPNSAFHPRTYNLSLANDAHEFDLDFKWTAAAALLRLLLKHGGFHTRWVPCEDTARVALRVCGARLAYLRDLVEEDIKGGRSSPLPDLSEEEWNLLLSAPAFQMSTSMHYTVKVRRRRTSSNAASAYSGSSHGSLSNPRRAEQEISTAEDGSDESSDESEGDSEACDGDEDVDGSAKCPQQPTDSQVQTAEAKQDENGQSADAEGCKWRCILENLGAHEEPLPNGSKSQETSLAGGSSKSSSGSSEKRAQAAVESEIANALQFGKVEEHDIEKMTPALRSEVVAMLSALRARVPQWDIDGPDNIWIVKPGGKSRGRGIHCFNNLPKLRQQVRADACQGGQTQQLVAQKYIETPLLAMGRKFDIRQWVLVTSWRPLTVWFYTDCYVRFCAEDYKPSNFDNIFCHLSNNSIAKKSRKFESEDATGMGNMWTSTQMCEWLKTQDHPKAQWPAIQARMKQIALYTLLGAQDTIDKRNRSFELFGYDFIIDANFKVWLLEVNCSPTFEHSTPITTRLIKKLSEDVIRVTVDLYATRGGGSTSPTRGAPASALDTCPAAAKENSSNSKRTSGSSQEESHSCSEISAHEEKSPKPCSSESNRKDSEDTAAEDIDQPLNGRSGTNATAAYIRSLDGLDTGGFECIFRDVVRAPGGPLWPSFGAAASDCLALQCTAVKPPPKPSPPRHTLTTRYSTDTLNKTAAAPDAPAAAAAAKSRSRPPATSPQNSVVYDQRHEVPPVAAARSSSCPVTPSTSTVIADAAAAAAAAVAASAAAAALNTCTVRSFGANTAPEPSPAEASPAELHASQHPQLISNVQVLNRPQTPNCAATSSSSAGTYVNCSSGPAAPHSTSATTLPSTVDNVSESKGRSVDQRVLDVSGAASNDTLGQDISAHPRARDAQDGPSGSVVRAKARMKRQAVVDASVPDILKSIDNTVSEAERTASITNASEATAAESSASQSQRAATTEATPSASPVPLTLNAASLFPLTQTAEEILAAPPTATAHPMPSAGPTVTLTSAVSTPAEFSHPHRLRAWQDAARVAVSKSKIVQQLREERASRGQPALSNTKGPIKPTAAVKSKGDVLPMVDSQAQERQRVQLANMMTGRLLRAHKHTRGRGNDDQVGSAWRIKDTEQGFTFERVSKDGKNPSQYSSSLFGNKKPDAAAPCPAVQAPDWAVAAATVGKKA